MSLKFYTIDPSYTDYLRIFEEKIPQEHPGRYNRPYIGIILEIRDLKYFAPMSSPKPKHRNLKGFDVYTIGGGEYGVINFNNMFPVSEGSYNLIDIDNTDLKYKELLYNQFRDIQKNNKKIKTMAKKIYSMYIHNHIPKNLKSRCCNFPLLEEKSRLYK